VNVHRDDEMLWVEAEDGRQLGVPPSPIFHAWQMPRPTKSRNQCHQHGESPAQSW